MVGTLTEIIINSPLPILKNGMLVTDSVEGNRLSKDTDIEVIFD